MYIIYYIWRHRNPLPLVTSGLMATELRVRARVSFEENRKNKKYIKYDDD